MKKRLISIILPTYKESSNIPPLVRRLDEVMTAGKIDYEIIIVDDDSRDGIDTAVDQLSKSYPVRLHVRTGEKGLSSAVIKGFSLAEGDIFVVMDADLSHPPSAIPEMIQPIIDGTSEFVIGSRFVRGGAIENFNWYRNLNAWAARILARPLTAVKDPMSGFFAIPRKLVNDTSRFNPLGFKIGLELLAKTMPKNPLEVPIHFQKRLYGESKLSLKEQVLYLRHLLRLYRFRYNGLVQFIMFSIIGSTGVLVNLFIVFLAYEVASLSYFWSLIAGFMFALTSNFFLNRYLTFTSAKNNSVFSQYLTFFLTCLTGLMVNMFISVYLYNHNGFFHKHYLLTTLLGIISGMIINFTGSKLLVFKE
jgi:dolichol-phosphate mannosyltransferase